MTEEHPTPLFLRRQSLLGEVISSSPLGHWVLATVMFTPATCGAEQVVTILWRCECDVETQGNCAAKHDVLLYGIGHLKLEWFINSFHPGSATKISLFLYPRLFTDLVPYTAKQHMCYVYLDI